MLTDNGLGAAMTVTRITLRAAGHRVTEAGSPDGSSSATSWPPILDYILEVIDSRPTTPSQDLDSVFSIQRQHLVCPLAHIAHLDLDMAIEINMVQCRGIGLIAY